MDSTDLSKSIPPTSASDTTTGSDISNLTVSFETPPTTAAVERYDDEIPGLIETVTAELGSELDTDIAPEHIAGRQTSAELTQERIAQAIECAEKIGFCLQRLLSPDGMKVASTAMTATFEDDNEMYGLRLEAEALRGDLKAELLLLGRLCEEISQEAIRYDDYTGWSFYRLSAQVIDCCHPYELLEIAYRSPHSNPQHLLSTRLSSLYELEKSLTHLSTLFSQQSKWNFIIRAISSFFA